MKKELFTFTGTAGNSLSAILYLPEGHPDCASFGESGWAQTLADMQAFSELLISRFAGIPLVLMGFSLGSFLVRDYLSSDCIMSSAAVIMGTGTQPSLILSGIKKLVEREIKKEGFNSTTPLIHKLSFETYNQKFKPAGTDFDWLCSDERELDIYMSDPAPFRIG